jgi:chromosome segregation ATPase
MNISNDAGGIDSSKFVEYFTKHFLVDLGRMAALRDELEARQGAMSAVDQINADKDEAKALIEKAKADFAERDKNHKEKSAVYKARKAALEEAEADLEARIEALEASSVAQNKSLTAREEAIAVKTAANEALALTLEAKSESIKQDREALDARIAAFQEKVAAISV